MKILFRPVTHSADEISMGQVIHYRPLPEADGVSVTANADGFTTLTAMARLWGVSLDHAQYVSNHINNLKSKPPCILVLEDPFKHSLIFVPKTESITDATAMTRQILEYADGEGVKVLEFTHFNFIQGQFPDVEISSSLFAILNFVDASSLASIIFDVDSRSVDVFKTFFNKILAIPMKWETV